MKKLINIKIKIVNRGAIEVEALSIENKDRFLIIKTTDNKTIIVPLYNLEYILYQKGCIYMIKKTIEIQCENYFDFKNTMAHLDSQLQCREDYKNNYILLCGAEAELKVRIIIFDEADKIDIMII